MLPKTILLLALMALMAALPSCVSTPPHVSAAPASINSWYEFDWLTTSPYAPTFQVMDTESALGPYAQRAKTITLGDLVRMHGHACDGLVVAAAAMSVALTALYPDGVIDRTDTGCISNNSPCFGDVAAYLTGARIRFGTQKIEPTRGMSFVVHCFTTGESIEVELRQGIFPADLTTLEAKLRSGEFTKAEMRACQQRQWQFARELLQHPLTDSFRTKRLPRSTWVPDAYPNTGPRGDIVNRSATRQ